VCRCKEGERERSIEGRRVVEQHTRLGTWGTWELGWERSHSFVVHWKGTTAHSAHLLRRRNEASSHLHRHGHSLTLAMASTRLAQPAAACPTLSALGPHSLTPFCTGFLFHLPLSFAPQNSGSFTTNLETYFWP
jgi:hypothetical protein